MDKNTSSEYLNMLLDAGLDPIAIDIYPVALERCFSSLDIEEPYCIMDIGASLTKLVIIKDGYIYADNIIHLGIQKPPGKHYRLFQFKLHLTHFE